MDAKHTPGPDGGCRLHGPDGELLGIAYAGAGLLAAERAAQYAAAPELLEILEVMLAWHEAAGVASPMVIAARAALAGAEGKSGA